MAVDVMQCPLCGFSVRGGKHPKDGSTVEVHIETLNHLNVYHQREIAERLARSHG